MRYPGIYFGKSEYPKVIRTFHRMMMGYESVVRMRGVYDDKGNFVGWALRRTDIPISEHDRHFLRERGLPVPGRFKCTLSVCQAKRYAVQFKAVP